MVQNYIMAKEAKEVPALLAQYEGRGRIIAGGTDLVLDLQRTVSWISREFQS